MSLNLKTFSGAEWAEFHLNIGGRGSKDAADAAKSLAEESGGTRDSAPRD